MYDTCNDRTKVAVRKVGHRTIKTKVCDFEAHVLIGWLARIFASQPSERAPQNKKCFYVKRKNTNFICPLFN